MLIQESYRMIWYLCLVKQFKIEMSDILKEFIYFLTLIIDLYI